MVEHTCESTNPSAVHPTPSVWRDTALGLAASLGVGFLTGTALTFMVFAIVAISIGQ